MIAAAAVMMLALVVISMIPNASAADEPTTYADIRAESYIAGTGKSIDYTIFAFDDTTNVISFTAKLTDANGNTVSRVSPTTGNVAAAGTTITITAPGSDGIYSLVVDFKFTDSGDNTKTVTRSTPLKVVVPVTLSATLENKSGTIASMNVWFVVDTTLIEESKQNITIEEYSTKTVTYEWITESLGGGRHTVALSGEVGPIRETVAGLDEPSDFFIGQTSYKLTEALLVVLIIVLLIVLIIVIRKPVKNVGKPKGRR
jgi:hypothetical protein